MFRIYHSKKFYIIDEFGKSIGSFNEKYYAELFVSLVNSQAAAAPVGVADADLVLKIIPKNP